MLLRSIRTLFKLQKCIFVLLFISFISGMLLGIHMVTKSDISGNLLNYSKIKGVTQISNEDKISRFANSTKTHTQLHVEEPHRTAEERIFERKKEVIEQRNSTQEVLSYNVHVFYYPWYCNKDFDGDYFHWNHQIIQHWDKREAAKWPKGQHSPPDDVGSNFYPELGPYSSNDPKTVANHMMQIKSAGIGVIVVSWYPPGLTDENGKIQSDAAMPLLLETANKYEIKVCFHIEPYKGRNSLTLVKYIDYIQTKYGSHPAYYHQEHRGRNLPMIYIYDTYLIKNEEWASILRPDGKNSIRNTENDAIIIGLLVKENHKNDLILSGFDGFYTYFASDGFTYGSSTRNWESLAHFAVSNNILFIPSVGPGYDDTRIRPWNAANTKLREHGGYYEQSFKMAINIKPPFISITSFNEWGEGTQIERAIKKKIYNYKYLDYEPYASDYYLTLTKKWIDKYNIDR